MIETENIRAEVYSYSTRAYFPTFKKMSWLSKVLSNSEPKFLGFFYSLDVQFKRQEYVQPGTIIYIEGVAWNVLFGDTSTRPNTFCLNTVIPIFGTVRMNYGSTVYQKTEYEKLIEIESLT